MIFRVALRVAFAGALACAPALPADPPLEPVSVCDVVRDLPAMEGKSVAVLGRYSFRDSGTSLGEQSCQPAVAVPAQLRLREDSKDGPKPPGSLEIDATGLRQKLADLRKRTSLGKFRFGSSDYDRWAVVYGRVEAAKSADGKTAPASLVFRGDGVVIFLAQ
jgi:hypothetical protein